MTDTFKQCLWKNFGATIDMLKNAINLCPDELWYKEKKFFYMAYHTAIFLDYNLSNPVSSFKSTLPYTIIDSNKLPAEAIDDVIPNKLYSKQEVLDYLSFVRSKCKNLISQASENKLNERWIDDAEVDLHGLCPSTVVNYTLLEILFYNFRHVQHHVGQLNLILRQKINAAPDWVSLVDD